MEEKRQKEVWLSEWRQGLTVPGHQETFKDYGNILYLNNGFDYTSVIISQNSAIIPLKFVHLTD